MSTLDELVEKVSALLADKGVMLVTAESCTGGLIAKLITDRAGSSAIFERGFVTYSNQSKTEMLGVPSNLIEKHGAVSAEVAEAMAKGALKNSNADIALSITGIAGPGGGSPEKPLGLVYIGCAIKDHIEVKKCHFEGTREQIRKAAALEALKIILIITTGTQ